MGKKGFTLIELVVSLAVASILALTMIEIVAPLYQTYRRVTEKADAQLIAGNVLDVMRRSASTANTVTAVDDGVKIGRVTYSAPDGRLCQDEENVFAPAYYAGKILTIAASQVRENMASVTVYLYTAEGELVAKAGTVLSPLMNAAVDYGESTAPGLYLSALSAIQSYKGNGGASGIFDLIREGSYNNAFPIFDIETLISKSCLSELSVSAAAEAGNDPDAPFPSYYRALAEKELTLTTYIVTTPENTYEPLIYLTDSPELLEDQKYAPAYLVYYHGLWYARTQDNVNSMDTILRFDGCRAEDIEAMLQTSGAWARLDGLA